MMLWLQGLFLFALIWGLGGTITGDSRKKFDTFLRDFLTGAIEEHPKPKSIKFSKVKSSKFPFKKTNKYLIEFRRISFLNEIHVSISISKKKQPVIGVIGRI